MKFVPIIAVLAVAACSTQPAVTTPPVEMMFNAPVKDNPDSFDFTTVRVKTGRFSNRQDVNNARCEAYGDGFSAQFTSPAILKLPLYRGRTEDVRIICRATVDNRAMAGAETIPARNLSAPTNEGVTISVGSRGSSIGAVFSLRDRKKDRFSYPNEITLDLQ